MHPRPLVHFCSGLWREELDVGRRSKPVVVRLGAAAALVFTWVVLALPRLGGAQCVLSLVGADQGPEGLLGLLNTKVERLGQIRDALCACRALCLLYTSPSPRD